VSGAVCMGCACVRLAWCWRAACCWRMRRKCDNKTLWPITCSGSAPSLDTTAQYNYNIYYFHFLASISNFISRTLLYRFTTSSNFKTTLCQLFHQNISVANRHRHLILDGDHMQEKTQRKKTVSKTNVLNNISQLITSQYKITFVLGGFFYFEYLNNNLNTLQKHNSYEITQSMLSEHYQLGEHQ